MAVQGDMWRWAAIRTLDNHNNRGVFYDIRNQQAGRSGA